MGGNDRERKSNLKATWPPHGAPQLWTKFGDKTASANSSIDGDPSRHSTVFLLLRF